MTEQAKGTGTAGDATVSTTDGENGWPIEGDIGSSVYRASLREEAEAAVAAAERAVDKARAQLEGAREAVRQAKADLAAVPADEGGKP